MNTKLKEKIIESPSANAFEEDRAASVAAGGKKTAADPKIMPQKKGPRPTLAATVNVRS